MTDGEGEFAALHRMTPDLAAEVRRNLIVWVSYGVTGVAAISGLFALAVDPGVSGVTGRVAVLMFAMFLAFLAPFAGLLLALVYLFDCWPTMLRGRLLQDRFGVTAAELGAPEWRQAMRSNGFWAAAGRGAIVGWAFVSVVLLGWLGVTGKWTFVGPSSMLVVMASQFSARAWFVRRAVEKSRSKSLWVETGSDKRIASGETPDL